VREAYSTRLPAVMASTKKTMKMMIATKNRTRAIVAAPAEMLVEPKMPATMEIRKNPRRWRSGRR
jgi:hypothetical protein